MIFQNNRKVRKLSKLKTADCLVINTTLMNKDEVFRILALALVMQKPLLLEGPPGVAKTKAAIEFAKALMLSNIDKDDPVALENANREFMDKIFILETDEGTKSTEVKGMPDLEKLFNHNKIEIIAPITEAEVVIVNEIDKASPSIRHALLGVMNERYLFSGKVKVPCKWKLFIGTCNGIPKDEIEEPFWDRFIIKMKVNPITAGELLKYFEKGGRNYRETVSVGIPSNQELESIKIPSDKMAKFFDVSFNECSNRTLTFSEDLAKAVSFIWNLSVDSSLVKVCTLMVNDGAASDLKDKLLSPAMNSILKKVDMLRSNKTQTELDTALAEIGNMVSSFASNNEIVEQDVNDIDSTINYIIDNMVLEEEKEAEEEFAN
jgi:hypothetical protein